MRKPDGYDEVAAVLAGEYERLEAGGYICNIMKVSETISSSGRNMVVIDFDIAKGERKGYFSRQYEADNRANKKWSGRFWQLTDGNATSVFKGVIEAIEESNPGYIFDWNENTLCNKLMGVLFGEEEYQKQDGTVIRTIKPRYIRSVQSIQAGKFVIPKPKLLDNNNKANIANTGFNNISTPVDDDEDLPF